MTPVVRVWRAHGGRSNRHHLTHANLDQPATLSGELEPPAEG
jgi:hypothetical protein